MREQKLCLVESFDFRKGKKRGKQEEKGNRLLCGNNIQFGYLNFFFIFGNKIDAFIQMNHGIDNIFSPERRVLFTLL